MTSVYNGTQILMGLVNNDRTIYAYISTTYLPLIKGMLTNKGLPFCQLENRSRAVLQETICQLWIFAKANNRYEETGAFKPWFMAIASRVASTLHRTYQKQGTVSICTSASEEDDSFKSARICSTTIPPDFVPFDQWSDPTDLEWLIDQKMLLGKYPSLLDLELVRVETTMLNEEQLKRHQTINQHFKRLTATEQRALKLYWKDRLLIAEIADCLDKTESSVKVILHRGKNKLRAWCKMERVQNK